MWYTLAMKKICMMHAGGTIAMIKNAAGVLEPAVPGDHILDYVPGIKALAEIDHVFLFQLDSSDVNPRHWQMIAAAISERYDQYDGFVILHGTDTMAYTATALSFMLGHIGKPVILTGSQLPISEITSDGQGNLLHAIQVACSDLSEVAIMFGHYLLRGNRAKKMHEFNLNSFISPNCWPLAELGVELRLADHCLYRRKQTLTLQPDLVNEVVVIKIFPGITNELVLGMVPPRTKGVVIEAYGSGNIPLGKEGIQEAIENIIGQDIVVVITTQCFYGRVEYERYQGGYFAKSHGALSAQDMTTEAAVIKLMWVLAQTKDFEKIKKLYHTNLVGELTELHS